MESQADGADARTGLVAFLKSRGLEDATRTHLHGRGVGEGVEMSTVIRIENVAAGADGPYHADNEKCRDRYPSVFTTYSDEGAKVHLKAYPAIMAEVP